MLPSFSPHPPKNEIYLTDAIALAAKEGKAQAVVLSDFDECQGVNDRWALAEASRILQERVCQRLALQGVGFEDPLSNTIEESVEIAPEAYIERGAILRGNTQIGAHTRIGAYSIIENSHIAAHVSVRPYTHIEHAKVGENCRLGPYARLREGTVLSERCHIGNFVETKKSTFANGSKANHLSYVGDASVGERVNIGAGTITCNYDGFQKHKTIIDEGAFIGSNSSLVAPVQIGSGAIVGAGSTIAKNVPSDSIAIVRSTQKNVEGAAPRFRAKCKAAKEKSQS